MENNKEFNKNIFNISGLSSLSNMGFTCYINSVLQCLSATKLFNSFILNNMFNEELKDENIKKRESMISFNLKKLFEEMWKNNQQITPKTLVSLIHENNKNFKIYEQEDSQEFLGFMLDKIHDETSIKTNYKINDLSNQINIENINQMSNSLISFENLLSAYDKPMIGFENDTEFKKVIQEEMNNYINDNYNTFVIHNYLKYLIRQAEIYKLSIISYLFKGCYSSEIICKECNKKSLTFEESNMLQLSLPEENKQTELKDCIKNYFSEELLEGENKYHCDNCNKKVNALRKNRIFETPNILIIHLKRYKNYGNKCMKNNIFINYPFGDDLLSFKSFSSEYYKNDSNYELYAVIHQIGNLQMGHYIAFTKNSLNDKWYEYNDQHIVHVPDEDIQKTIINSNSYILFYQKKN